MDWTSAGVGFVAGLVATFFRSVVEGFALRAAHPLGKKHDFLLRVARAADGKLKFRKDYCISGPPLLWMKGIVSDMEPFRGIPREWQENTGQVQRLILRGLLELDPAAGDGRYKLTAHGWHAALKLKALDLGTVQREPHDSGHANPIA